MRTTALVLAALFATTALLAVAPAAEARAFCTYNTGDPCDDHLACVWNYVEAKWECVGYIDPCWFVCWYP